MVKVRSFKGFLANQENAQKIISPPYDVLNTEEARAMADGNPMSFLHCTKPEIDLPPETDPYDMKVYEGGRDTLKAFVEKGYLIQDPEPIMYVYQQTMGSHSQKGVVALASVEDYENNRIKKHEFTLAKKEEDRTKLTNIQNANSGPVFLTFRENQEAIKQLIDQVSSRPCYADVTCDDGVRHVLWRSSLEESKMFEEEFAKVPNTYIADGHHRAASAYNVGKIRRQNRIDAGDNVTGEEPFNFFMALHYPADNLMILDYNRVLKSLNGLSSSDFITKMSEHFTINLLAEGTDTKPGATHKFSLYIDNKWHSMVLKEEYLDKSTPITQLDSQILTDLVFGPILGITDLKKDNRIDFVGGIRGHKELERRCQLDCVAAIALHPCSIQELMNVADANLIMPPKSTWFEPKPRCGFCVRIFENEH